MASMNPTSIPVKVVLRKSENPLKGAVSGALAGALKDMFDERKIMAIMPYARIANDGANANNLVRVMEIGDEYVCDWTQLIKDTLPATPDEAQDLLTALNEHGYEVEVIKATQVDHIKRKSLFMKKADDQDMVVEDITIECDIVNDDIEAETGIGSKSFAEEWA